VEEWEVELIGLDVRRSMRLESMCYRPDRAGAAGSIRVYMHENRVVTRGEDGRTG
jgi:hypothetical protein